MEPRCSGRTKKRPLDDAHNDASSSANANDNANESAQTNSNLKDFDLFANEEEVFYDAVGHGDNTNVDPNITEMGDVGDFPSATDIPTLSPQKEYGRKHQYAKFLANFMVGPYSDDDNKALNHKWSSEDEEQHEICLQLLGRRAH